MRSSFLLRAGCLLLFFAGCRGQAPSVLKYGAPLSLSEETKISQVLREPENYLGTRVLVQGEIVDVCAKAGCWLEIAGDQPGQKIKIKVNDGEIVFPVTAKEKAARVEGEVYKIELSHEQALGYMAHVAEEQGAAFDSSSVAGPMVIYQIKGLGAEIEQ